jgi:hypothetical protein
MKRKGKLPTQSMRLSRLEAAIDRERMRVDGMTELYNELATRMRQSEDNRRRKVSAELADIFEQVSTYITEESKNV